MKPILGIDLGTTKCVACVRLGEDSVDIEVGVGGQSILPSVFVYLNSTGEAIVGDKAANTYGRNQQYKGHVVRNVKRYMGRDAQVGAPGPKREFASGGKLFSPSEIAAEYLRALRNAAKLQTPKLMAHPQAAALEWDNWLDAVVVTVPAYFGKYERDATRRAAALAGFKETSIYIVNEPTAAALALGIYKQRMKQLALVVDLGGGTCDFTLLSTDGSGEPHGLREVGLFGDNHFGGLEWDLGIADMARRKSALGKKISHLIADDGLPDYIEYGQLFADAEDVKKDFCREGDRFTKRSIFVTSGPGKTPETVVIGRADFEKLSEEHSKYCGVLCDELLRRIDPVECSRRHAIRWEDVDAVLLVGGGGQVPHVRSELARKWGRAPIAPSEAQMAIGRGAAIYGQLIARNAEPPHIGAPRCQYDTGIMTEADVPPLRRLLGKFGIKPRRNGSEKHLPLNFEVLIKRNARLPTDVVAVEWAFPDPDPARVKFELCVMAYSRRAPRGSLGQLRKEEIKVPALSRKSRATIKIFMWYDELHNLHCIAEIGGQRYEVRIEPWYMEHAKEFQE